MILTKIWEKHFLKEFTKTILFILFAFYGLYVLIDYANHAANFHKHQISFKWSETSLYYVYEFIKQMNILIPLALLISCIRVLTNLNDNNELIALLSSGVSMHRVLKPFLFVGAFCTFLIYFNTEFFAPVAMEKLKGIEDSRNSKSNKRFRTTAAEHISLEDGSIFLFQNYEAEKKRFFDAFWVKSGNEIYRIKYLYPNIDSNQPPSASFIDHLVRNSQGNLVNRESVASKVFMDLKFNSKALFETLTIPEEQSLTMLWEKFPKLHSTSEKDSQIVSAFYHKLIIPWFCLLAIIAPAPFCVQKSRNIPIFFIYALSIFGLICLNLVLNAAILLAKRQTLPSFWIIWPLFLIPFCYFIYRFYKVN